MSLDNAAAAFDAAIGNRSAAPVEQSDDNGGPVESMFGNLGVLDDDSPEAGGDALPLKGRVEPAARGKRQELPVEDEDDVERDPFEDLENFGDNTDDEGGEGDEGPDDENEDEDDGDAEKDPNEPVYEVTVDGERQEVTLSEALSGYIREKTFHQRLAKLNDYKGVLRDEAVKVIKQRDEYTDIIDKMRQSLDLLVPQEPDWAEEYAKDPVAAKALQQQFNNYKKQREALDAESKRIKDETAKEDAENMKAYINAENVKILNNIPAMRKDETRKAALNAMAETARALGFTDEEIANTYDSRMVGVLYKAMLYDRLKASKGIKPIRNGKGNRTVKPGAAPRNNSSGPASKGVRQAQRNLSRTGSIEDAAQVFANLIHPPRRR